MVASSRRAPPFLHLRVYWRLHATASSRRVARWTLAVRRNRQLCVTIAIVAGPVSSCEKGSPALFRSVGGQELRMPIDARQLSATWHPKRVLGRVGRWSLKGAWIGLALIGFLHLTRGTAVRHVEGIGTDETPIAVSEAQFPLKATMLTGAWLAPGNRVEIALNGEGTYPRLWEDLRSAERSITLQVYYGGMGRMARELGQILLDRAAAGVRVRVLYDAFGTSGIPSAQLDILRAAGVIVEAFRPIRLSTLHLAQHRSHVRGIVIDDRIAWTGGFGIDDKWFG